jgi:hypothetical protein
MAFRVVEILRVKMGRFDVDMSLYQLLFAVV